MSASEEIKSTAAAEDVKSEKPKADSTTKVEEKPAKETSKPAAKPEASKAEAPKTEAPKKETSAKKEEKPAVKAPVKKEEKPAKVASSTVVLSQPVATYRAPADEFIGKTFGGTVTVVDTVDNFYKVQFVRAGVGVTEAYMKCQEVDACRS